MIHNTVLLCMIIIRKRAAACIPRNERTSSLRALSNPSPSRRDQMNDENINNYTACAVARNIIIIAYYRAQSKKNLNQSANCENQKNLDIFENMENFERFSDSQISFIFLDSEMFFEHFSTISQYFYADWCNSYGFEIRSFSRNPC